MQKKIEAIIKPFKLQEIKHALPKQGSNGKYGGPSLAVLPAGGTVLSKNKRSTGKVTNKFDDTLTISFKDEHGQWKYYEFDW